MTDEILEDRETAPEVEETPQEPEKSPKEQGEEKLAKILNQHPELKNYAKFTVNNEGEIVYKYVLDFKDFDISFEDYFFAKNHPNDENARFIDGFYEKLNNVVMAWCNESGEYTIDCWQDRYTVRKISEVEQRHYDSLSDDEKKAYNERKLQEKIDNKRFERDNLLTTVVDPIVTNPLRWEELSEAEQSKYRAYRLYLLDIPQQEEFPDIEIKSFEEFLQ